MVNSRVLPGGRVAALAAVTGAALLCASAVSSPATAGAAVSHSTARAAHSRPATTSDKFWEGSDSWPMTVSGSAPYKEPGIGHDYSYGGYIGMAGNWAYQEGCHGQIAWSPTNSQDANI